MKKYKLKKDLPTWKAGEEFWIGEDECLYGLSEEGEPIMVYHAITLVNFGLLKNGEWLEEVIEKPKSIWDLKVGDFYFCILESGEVERFDILDEILFETYKKDLEIGNVFITEEEAEKELERRKAIQKIKKYCWENGIETEHNMECSNNNSFYLTWGKVKFVEDFKNGNPIGYFSEENAEKILEKFEDELKIILDV